MDHQLYVCECIVTAWEECLDKLFMYEYRTLSYLNAFMTLSLIAIDVEFEDMA